jgi:hypothetical protein
VGRSAVAEALIEEDRARLARMEPAQRVELALALGREAVVLFAKAHGLSLSAARRELTQRKHAGRRPSVASSF